MTPVSGRDVRGTEDGGLRFRAVVLDELRHQDDDPAGKADRPADAA